MKNLFTVILAGILMTGCQQMQGDKTATVDLDLEKEKVELVLEKYVLANEKQDIEYVHEIWAESPDIVVIGTNSDEKLVGWESIREVMQRQFDSFQDTYISVHEQVIEINETGNTAWFSEFLNYNYIYQGEAKQYEGLRFTGVLEKIDGEWYIVQSHMSIPGNPE
jgi:ketosteroid isomerase-like protein